MKTTLSVILNVAGWFLLGILGLMLFTTLAPDFAVFGMSPAFFGEAIAFLIMGLVFFKMATYKAKN